MTEKQLSFHQLNVTVAEVYDEMGYHGSTPDKATQAETAQVLAEVSRWLRPRFCYQTHYGVLDGHAATLLLENTQTPFHLNHIIAAQLRGAEAYAIFVATAGTEYEDFQQRLTREGDMVKVFIANALGTVITEKCADEMEVFLQSSIEKIGWKHTSRFSPGYCGWHVSEQQRLFALFPEAEPCGVRLTDSSLMVPIKSVSGIIGVGSKVTKRDYSCGLCTFEHCYKKKQRD